MRNATNSSTISCQNLTHTANRTTLTSILGGSKSTAISMNDGIFNVPNNIINVVGLSSNLGGNCTKIRINFPCH